MWQSSYFNNYLVTTFKSKVYTYVNKIFPECLCNEDGSTSISCDDISGNCVCRPNVVGSKCDQCDDSHYDFPDCPGIMIINNI